ncbi:hypothetical protein BJG92_00459 [Arthrobacter sp. SO5]|uniref:hypothetical protein n=1 Tax=Arthrobacter sp. SO5 TaxID=1897055 RepID=UPI001E5C4021|nr:hypothetical protein [Arthrobacter sp. SO5]MCB5272947.1 hypothetical protein [Arthrobacter sp. SO5]
MENTLQDRSRKDSVAVVRWSKKPGENPAVRFVLLGIVGLILCLFLMIFMSGLRSFGAVVLFMAIFPAILTVPTVSSQRSFMRGVTRRVNDAIAEVTNTAGDQLSVREFGRLVKSGERLALLVSGVPGLNLHVERVASAENDTAEKWCAVFSVVPPENGTASFDRLVAAAMDADAGSTSAA